MTGFPNIVEPLDQPRSQQSKQAMTHLSIVAAARGEVAMQPKCGILEHVTIWMWSRAVSTQKRNNVLHYTGV